MSSLIIVDRILTILATLIFPFLLAFWFFKNYKKSWKTVGIGALSYFIINLIIGVTMLLISFVNPDSPKYFLISFFGLIPGVLAAIFEEIVRLFSMKLFLKKTFNWQNAFLFGIGWGGVESIIFGFGKIFELVVLGNEPIFSYLLPFGISRIVAIFGQIALSILMVQVFIQRKPIFFLYAFSYHTTVNIILTLLSPMISKGGIIRYTTDIFVWIILIILPLVIIHKFEKEKRFSNIIKNSIKKVFDFY